MKQELDKNQKSIDTENKWLIAIRLFLLSAAMLLVTLATNEASYEENTEKIIYIGIAGVFAVCAFSAWWINNRRGTVWFTIFQLVLDALVITGAIYISGAAASPILFLYIPNVIFAAILFGRHMALIAVILNSAAYSGMTYCLIHGRLPLPPNHESLNVPVGGYLVQILGLVSVLVLTAISSVILVRKFNFSLALAEKSTKDLSELGRQRELLINELEEGIISTDLGSMITSVNQAAGKILGINEVSALGLPLSTLAPEIDLSQVISHPGQVSEFEVLDAKNENRSVNARCKQILTDSGEHTGFIFLFRDITGLKVAEEQLILQERFARLRAQDAEAKNNSLNSGKELQSKSLSKSSENFVGESSAMQNVFALIKRVSQSDSTVLIHGESGTGKELVAKAVHEEGMRKNKPFVAVNCGAIPENLIESELFGHKKGAFTGADSDALGMFRAAEGGTLFLDEIGELPIHMQAKLLRVLQEKRVRPVGSEKDFPVDARIITATNRNLKDEVKSENFREDLFYRLNVISINLPALRERKNDIPLLVHFLLKRLAREGEEPLVPPTTMELLMRYDYPGNVRELENIIERALVLGGEVILPDHLPDYVRERKVAVQQNLRTDVRPETQILVDESISFPINLEDILNTIEKHYLEVALVKTNGAKKKAADLLGINFRSIRYRLQKYGLAGE